jgi:hypothetical protein
MMARMDSSALGIEVCDKIWNNFERNNMDWSRMIESAVRKTAEILSWICSQDVNRNSKGAAREYCRNLGRENFDWIGTDEEKPCADASKSNGTPEKLDRVQRKNAEQQCHSCSEGMLQNFDLDEVSSRKASTAGTKVPEENLRVHAE